MRALAFIALLLPLSSVGQEHPILNYFFANLQNGQVHLSWEIKGGSQCNGIQILRSTDSLGPYTEIGELAGVCGSPDFAQSYDFIDEQPVANAYNHYKIQLGVQGLSSIATIHYVQLLEGGYKVFPNPVTVDSRIFFNNPSNKTFSYDVFSVHGKKMISDTGLEGNELVLNQALPFRNVRVPAYG